MARRKGEPAPTGTERRMAITMRGTKEQISAQPFCQALRMVGDAGHLSNATEGSFTLPGGAEVSWKAGP